VPCRGQQRLEHARQGAALPGCDGPQRALRTFLLLLGDGAGLRGGVRVAARRARDRRAGRDGGQATAAKGSISTGSGTQGTPSAKSVERTGYVLAYAQGWMQHGMRSAVQHDVWLCAVAALPVGCDS
jgi:hypothetical protein